MSLCKVCVSFKPKPFHFHIQQHTTCYLMQRSLHTNLPHPSHPCVSINYIHLSACQFPSTSDLDGVFKFSATDRRLDLLFVSRYPSSQRNRAAIKLRNSWLTLSQNPPQEQEIHLSWQSSDGTTACIKSARSDSRTQGNDKNGNTISPRFYAWTACRPGMFL